MANARLDDGEAPLARAERLIAGAHAGEAVELLRTLIDTGRAGPLARLVFVRALVAAGDTEAALAAAREAASLAPHAVQSALALGEALLAADLLPASIAELQRALSIEPGLPRAQLLLAQAWLHAGEAEKAEAVLSAADDPETAGARDALLRQAEAMRGRPRADAGYVRHLFDQFAPDYDQRMRGHLGYRAPEILRQLAEMTGLGLRRHAIVDLGCGTGLGGAAFADIASRLDGVDLSPAMLAQARARALYGELIQGDLETALDARPGRYDLAIAADTFVYLGDLRPVFAGCALALAHGGHLLFTVEADDGAAYQLGPKRRWRHSESYLRGLAGETGFSVTGFLGCTPRHEAGVPVAGFAVALSKS
jgi:predicted TPR repeat methyltransferase